jgi:hypothetical protein
MPYLHAQPGTNRRAGTGARRLLLLVALLHLWLSWATVISTSHDTALPGWHPSSLSPGVSDHEPGHTHDGDDAEFAHDHHEADHSHDQPNLFRDCQPTPWGAPGPRRGTFAASRYPAPAFDFERPPKAPAMS